MTTYKVPFDQKGCLMHSTDDWWSWQSREAGIDWREAKPFHAWLAIKDMYRSGHSVYYIWEDRQGKTFPMLVSDMLTLLKTTNVVAGCVDADWVIVKRGRAYGIRKA